jgi:hypothetical protein
VLSALVVGPAVSSPMSTSTSSSSSGIGLGGWAMRVGWRSVGDQKKNTCLSPWRQLVSVVVWSLSNKYRDSLHHPLHMPSSPDGRQSRSAPDYRFSCTRWCMGYSSTGTCRKVGQFLQDVADEQLVS